MEVRVGFGGEGGKEGGGSEQIRKTQDEPQWIVAQGLLSALTIPGFNYVVCKRFIIPKVRNYVSPPELLTAAVA